MKIFFVTLTTLYDLSQDHYECDSIIFPLIKKFAVTREIPHEVNHQHFDLYEFLF